jgi:hypothetical protein
MSKNSGRGKKQQKTKGQIKSNQVNRRQEQQGLRTQVRKANMRAELQAKLAKQEKEEAQTQAANDAWDLVLESMAASSGAPREEFENMQMPDSFQAQAMRVMQTAEGLGSESGNYYQAGQKALTIITSVIEGFSSSQKENPSPELFQKTAIQKLKESINNDSVFAELKDVYKEDELAQVIFSQAIVIIDPQNVQDPVDQENISFLSKVFTNLPQITQHENSLTEAMQEEFANLQKREKWMNLTRYDLVDPLVNKVIIGGAMEKVNDFSDKSTYEGFSNSDNVKLQARLKAQLATSIVTDLTFSLVANNSVTEEKGFVDTLLKELIEEKTTKKIKADNKAFVQEVSARVFEQAKKAVEWCLSDEEIHNVVNKETQAYLSQGVINYVFNDLKSNETKGSQSYQDIAKEAYKKSVEIIPDCPNKDFLKVEIEKQVAKQMFVDIDYIIDNIKESSEKHGLIVGTEPFDHAVHSEFKQVFGEDKYQAPVFQTILRTALSVLTKEKHSQDVVEAVLDGGKILDMLDTNFVDNAVNERHLSITDISKEEALTLASQASGRISNKANKENKAAKATFAMAAMAAFTQLLSNVSAAAADDLDGGGTKSVFKRQTGYDSTGNAVFETYLVNGREASVDVDSITDQMH